MLGDFGTTRRLLDDHLHQRAAVELEEVVSWTIPEPSRNRAEMILYLA